MSIIAETQRIEIVSISVDDVDYLHELTGDADVMKYFPNVLTENETSEMVQKILDHYAKFGYCFWKVLRKPEAEFIGIAGILHQTIEDSVEAEIAFRIVKSHWNKGYATEAAKACLEYARATLGKTRLISIIHPKNASSLRVAEKLGAQKERSVSFFGTQHDVYVY